MDDARKHIQNHIRKHGKKDEVFKICWALLKHVEELKSDEELRVNIEGMLSGKSIETLKAIKPEKRNEILKIIKGMDGITQRQIARVTGINQSTISLA